MLDFRRCEACDAHFERAEEDCPICGRHAVKIHELVAGRGVLTRGVPGIAAVLAVLVLPESRGPWQTLLEGGVLALGLAPLLFALAWLVYRRHRRAPASQAARLDAIAQRLEGLEADLEATERRLQDARHDLLDEPTAKGARELRRELAQDRRLRNAQRRLVRSLGEQRERLEIEGFRRRLVFYEACRDARTDSPEVARELGARVAQIVREREEADRSARWDEAIDDARSLSRQLSRGVQRLHAARRLDPVAHADLGEAAIEARPLVDGELHAQTDAQLDRIDRSFEALDELRDLDAWPADGAGTAIRVRVSDADEEIDLDEDEDDDDGAEATSERRAPRG